MLRIIEILLLVVLPLLLFYLRSNWPRRQIMLYCTLFPLIWYITYAPIHEFSHMIGCFAVGKEITDYQLFSHFWEGNFGFAYVEIQDGYKYDIPSLIILCFPYLMDLLFVVSGYFLFRKFQFKNAFFAGLLFMLLLPRSLYDIIDNYIGFFYNHSDFVMIGEIIGHPAIFIYGIFTTVITLYIIYSTLSRYKNFPDKSVTI